jgi:methionyl-tRNA formyltransferase
MKIVFMGTPDFARAHLQSLLDIKERIKGAIPLVPTAPDMRVVGVFTQPDRASGRGLKPIPSPVKALAEERGIPVFQPSKMRDGPALDTLRGLKPDLVVVVAYGRILPREMLDVPPLGCVNVHASLLPELRGAAPIQWAIARGFERTGVTTIKMAEECDAGDIYFSESIPIGAEEDASSLHDRLRDLGAKLLQKTVEAIAGGSAVPTPQDHSKATFAPILRKEDGLLDITRPAEELERLVRAMNPWPGARLEAGAGGVPGAREEGFLKIHKARVIDGKLELLEVQAPGKRRMSAEEYFRGHR